MKFIKERLAIFINIEPLRITKARHKHKKGGGGGMTYCFIFITNLSFGFLGGWVVAAVEETWAFSLGSSFRGMRRVANTNSRL